MAIRGAFSSEIASMFPAATSLRTCSTAASSGRRRWAQAPPARPTEPRRTAWRRSVSLDRCPVPHRLGLPPRLRHEGALGIRQDQVLEALDRCGRLASPPKNPSPLEVCFCRLRRGRMTLCDALPERDRGAVLPATCLYARRESE